MVPLKNIGGLEYGPMCVLVKMTLLPLRYRNYWTDDAETILSGSAFQILTAATREGAVTDGISK